MALLASARSDISNIINEHGVSITIYAAPTYTKNDEGEISSVSLGTATTGKKAVIFPLEYEDFKYFPEGINVELSYRAHIEYDAATLVRTSLIKYGSDYYKIISMDKTDIESGSAFYELIIERLDTSEITIS